MKNWCFWTVVLEKTLKSPLDCKEIQPVHPKGDQSWIFIGRTDAEAETPILWSPDVKNWLTGKDPDAGKDWRQEEKEMTKDEVGWMVSPTQLTWVLVISGRWRWTGKPGVPQSMGLQRVRHDWATELNRNNCEGLPDDSVSKESACNAGDTGSVPGSGRFPGGGNSNPLQYSYLENPMDRGAWQVIVYGVSKSRTQLND